MAEETIFRRQDIPIGDRTITLQYKPIIDIFKFNEAPYIIIGSSMSGKTTLCLDLLTKFSKDCTNIYYVTSTEEDFNDNTIKMIPRAFRRKPKYKNLYDIWKEIEMQSLAIKNDELRLNSIIITLLGNEKASGIIGKLQTKQKQIQKDQLARYRGMNMEESKCIQYANDDANAFYIDTISRIILDSARTVGTRNLSADDMMILTGFVSKKPKFLLLLDDVSSELDSLSRDTHKVEYKGQTMKTGAAYESLLLDILTRGRHFGGIICMFLHDISIINRKSLINNLVLLNSAGAQKVINAHTFPDDMKKIVLTASPYVFNANFKYHFLYVNSLDSSKVAVSKADLHLNEQLELGSANEMFIKAYNDVASGMSNESIGANNDVSDDEYYSDEDNDEDINAYIDQIK